MKFWDREREAKWLKRYLRTEPNAILFVYGPKSSGKSTLLQKVIAEEKLDAFYYDLRMIPISSYKDVLSIFFRERGWRERIKEAVPGIASAVSKYFEVDSWALRDILELKLNPFEIMEDVLRGRFRRRRKRGYPMIVFDELQKLKEVYLNSPNNQRPLINELFNFFVRLTKVLHLSHVIVMTSDTFFIERIYGDSALKHTSRFYLVDFFDDETALRILLDEGLSKEDAEYVVEMAGGVPWVLEEVLEGEDPREVVEDLYRQEVGQLRELLGRVRDRDLRERLMGVLRGLLEGKVPDMLGDERVYVEKLVDMEILFYDPINGKVRFQSRLDERAVRELIP